MFCRSKTIAVVVALVVATMAVNLASAGNPRPYKGKSRTIFEPIGPPVDNVVTFSGVQVGEFLHFGRCRITSVHEVNLDTGQGAGTFTQTVANGASFKGTFQFQLISQTESVGEWQIIPGSGTGRLANLSGTGTLMGLETSPGIGIAKYKGNVSY